MKRNSMACVAALCLAAGALGAGTAVADTAPPAAPATVPAPSAAELAAARDAATAPATRDTLARFFARDGKSARSAAAPRTEGKSVPVHVLSPDFVAGKAGAPVARTEVVATPAVASDGQRASVWTARQAGAWQVVNIATGDDEFRYARLGERRLPGGTVFREPQIDGWYVTRGTKVLPLDEDATRAIGARGTGLDAYRDRVRAAYGDKLPGSAYAKKGVAGGYGTDGAPAPAVGGPVAGAPAPGAGAPAAAVPAAAGSTASGEGRDPGALTAASVASGTGAVLALALGGLLVTRLRRRA
ncbi:hypothetical protein [Streptomyces clavuligerus]|uniref:Integral membrane protein n=1 Tax=Streptomyces clavuligerus TaxID=1901 RepID=E2PYL0_STRCL|nr:hypothetical protein [Streptomyces clavuligerus]ANW22058.1 hypothetical protein BB341_22290 [Streptomyces clavuligerus]AXU16687.1 hypothetical protein D1794_23180 [Streptomyces clavuligerus]EFG06232.1 Hypothetical protein SCLAV_1154 [Streptomyces clavuligerus]MBY6305458.1 hypothetical protein [Streptomyces clavuligerus]QCS09453.1 hypothetical protein CRV15_22545 [Streptomyces clavuligerus]